LGGAAHVDLGDRVDRDWRPQATDVPALTSRGTGLDLDSEIRVYFDGDIPIDLAVRPLVYHRKDTYT
jgi:hypothetical protein